MAVPIRSIISPCSSSRHREASIFSPSCLTIGASLGRETRYFLGNRSFLQSVLKVQHGTKIKMDMVVNSVGPGTPPLPSDPSSGTSWKLWLVGMLFSVVLPFWKNKWWPLLKLKEQVSTALDAVEEVAEMVEKVADGVEKVADDIADHLPEGKLQKAARLVESVAREAAEGAALADDLIEKIEDVEKEVDSIMEQAKKKLKDEASDTEIEETKIKQATEIKSKISEIKEVNEVKIETVTKS